MATVKVVLRTKKNKEGLHPIAIRITQNRKSSFIHIEDIVESDWNAEEREVRKSHPNSKRINNKIAKKLAEVKDTSLKLETEKPVVSSQEIKETIKPPAETLFFAQAFSYLNVLWDGNHYNQYTAERPRIRHFKQFMLNPKPETLSAEDEKKERQENKKLTKEERDEKLKKFLFHKDISFVIITSGLLEKYSNYLKALGDKSKRTIMNHLSTIRSVYAHADRNSVIDAKMISPFGKKGTKIKFPPSQKEGLSKEEVRELQNVELADPRFDHIRNIWLFTYYFAGMRIADAFALKWSAIRDGRLYYAMGKNDKADSLKIPIKAQKIINIYKASKRSSDDFVFPELKDSPYLNNELYLERQINFITSRYDKFLNKYIAPAAGIEKSLTMHISRHTFGNVSGDKIPPQILQKLYRHSRIETTISYQANFIHKEMDQALDAVLED